MLLAGLLVFSADLAAQGALDGRWNTGEDNSIVEVFERDSEVFGKLVSSDNDKAKIGTEILRNFKEVDGVWTGKIYSAKRDKLMDATVAPSADVLNISVSAGMGSKKLTWKRVQM